MSGIEPRQFDFELPTHHVSVLEWGPADGPLIVALHGFPDTAWTWRRAALFLANAGYRVAAPFGRGYAPSGIPADRDYSVRALAADAVALHERLGGDDRATVIGHDQGAVTAAALAADPESPYRRAAALAIPPRHAWYTGYSRVPGLAESSFDWLARQLWHAWSPGYDPAADLAFLGKSVPGREHARAVLSYCRPGARPGLREPAVPLLYLHGDRDGCLGPRSFPAIAARLPENSRAVLLPRAGHFLHLEHPDVVAGHVLRFLG